MCGVQCKQVPGGVKIKLFFYKFTVPYRPYKFVTSLKQEFTLKL